ncbi:hypothetical protein IGS68_34855 (plasmid) [Skermanella sp. TT6]|uniref:Right handed beta helix domain-containing protein n=1 Tax=Skermanella cutis TaxID=2775420 RepID=A0ABX7BK75_9PROT|nr:hypothetical protein [Skermanella sp. TT6]QQP93961.1 hypothetical protein IGS68_34855 [Skermanella sp. TT6]
MRPSVIAGLLLTGTAIGTPALAATIEVQPGDNLEAKIRSARPGDTVAVRRGTYNGSLDLSTLHGDPGAPIRILSVDGKGAAVIQGSRDQAAVQANRISNVEMDGFHVVANAPGGGDVGGFKLWGPYGDIGNLKITNNLITGQGQDGFKLFNMSPTDQQSVLVAGNTIDGNWRQEAIDNVSVKNVRYEGNTIRGKAGFAGITWKAGSDGVQLVNNTIDIDADTAVSVGGYGNSRLNRMDRFPDEFQDNEAENSVVTGNTIRGDVRVISAENNRVEGNSITGSISNGQNSHMPGSITSRNNAIAHNRVTGGTGASAWNGNTDTQFERNVDGLANNFYDTDEQFWGAVERGEAGALRRLNDLVSGGIIVREGNRIINRATGQITSAVGNAIGDAVDTVLQPAEDYVDAAVETVKCNIGGAVIGGAASVVSGIFSGGRATLAAQIAQQMTAIAGNLCLGKQLAAQQRLVELARRDNAHGTADNAAGLNGMMTRTLPGLAQGGFLSSEQAIASQYGEVYPDAFPPMLPDDLVAVNRSMQAHERTVHLNSLAVQNRTVQEQADTLERARDHAAAGRAGDGIRSELQAMNAIGGEQIAAINSLTAATVANHRASTEIQLRDESRKAAANATAEEFMSTLATCGNCTIDRPFLGE